IASGGDARLSHDPHFVMEVQQARTPEELRRWGLFGEAVPALSFDELVPSPLAVTGTVSGQVRWLDPEGHPHLVRGAFVQILDGTTLGLLATSFTGLDGVNSATVTADSVQVRVFSRDLDGTRVRVFYAGQPNSPYFLQSPVTPMAAGATIDITSEQPIRGIPGAQSPDTPGDRNARAFSVYDA